MNNYYEILREVYIKYGLELFENKRKLRAYIKAFLYEFEEKNDIIYAVNNGVISEIIKNVKSFDDLESVKLCILVLVDNYKMEKTIAISVILSFVYAIFGECPEINPDEIVSCGELECLSNEKAVDGNEEFHHNLKKIEHFELISCSDNITVGLKSDGTVVTCGGTNHEIAINKVKSWTDIISISVGNNHIVGLKSDGTVVAVGENYSGQCNVSDWSDVKQIAAGCNFTVALTKNGKILVTTGGTKRKFGVDSIENVEFISVKNHNLGCIDINGRVAIYGEGYGDKFESAKLKAVVSEWNQIEYISVGMCHIVAINRNGLVLSAGSNSYGEREIEYWRDIVMVSAGKNYTVGIKKDGKVIAVGNNISGECNTQNWEDVIAISVGDNHTVGLKSDGSVVAVGDESHGECDVSQWKLL